ACWATHIARIGPPEHRDWWRDIQAYTACLWLAICPLPALCSGFYDLDFSPTACLFLARAACLEAFLVRTEEVLMLRTFVFAILLVCLVPIVAAQALGQEFLPAGTILHCTLDEPNFSSRTAEVGDPLLCHTGALPAVGHTVFARSGALGGSFQEYRD